ncbi:MarR family winged helix-turn-helix transcriptional regulator [Actinomadura sp. 6N118]|uniref:MarR family winged helix-turn-helix transcriptional regulator n=1 Tax=Actinomadura sp. 6N118 TaxID=3375151 RepID=UPI0037947657
MDSESPLSELLCFDLYAASRSVTSVYRVLLDPLGLTYPQYLVMLMLWRHGERTVRDLVDGLRLDYNTLSPLLKRLEARGLVERRRRPDDERSVTVLLTDEGRAMREKTRDVPKAISDAIGLDDGAIADLQEVLRTLASNATTHAAHLGNNAAK